MNNVQKLINAGLMLAGALPSIADQNTINGLSSTEVDALINIYNTLGANFLQRNCNVTSVGAVQGVRTIGIVF